MRTSRSDKIIILANAPVKQGMKGDMRKNHTCICVVNEV